MTPIPFEPQEMIDGSRMCGAAALTMVYRSLGMDSRQLEVWHRVAEEVRPGVKATRTRRLALDAHQAGFCSVVLQAARPAELLRQLSESETRVILNHRLDPQSHLGHYAVLVRFHGGEIEIHDPYRGPNYVRTWSEFEELWQPGNFEHTRLPARAALSAPTGSPPAGRPMCRDDRLSRRGMLKRCEIIGGVLVAIGATSAEIRSCRECGNEVPTHWMCARCSRLVSIGPDHAVRCVVPECRQRLWRRLFCPHCDWARK